MKGQLKLWDNVLQAEFVYNPTNVVDLIPLPNVEPFHDNAEELVDHIKQRYEHVHKQIEIINVKYREEAKVVGSSHTTNKKKIEKFIDECNFPASYILVSYLLKVPSFQVLPLKVDLNLSSNQILKINLDCLSNMVL